MLSLVTLSQTYIVIFITVHIFAGFVADDEKLAHPE